MYAAQYFPEITELLRRLPRVILLMLKTNDCLRAVNNSLVLHSVISVILIINISILNFVNNVLSSSPFVMIFANNVKCWMEKFKI